MPYNGAVIYFLLGVDLVLVWTCASCIQGQNVRADMSEKDNTESEGWCGRNLKPIVAGVVIFASLLVISLFTLLSWVYVEKVPDTPYSKEESKHSLFSYNHKYYPPHPVVNVRKSYQRSSVNGGNEMRLYIVRAGLLTGAVCLDGSPPAYYLRRGKDLGANRWIIHFNGGAWCFDESACLERSRSSLGSSRNLPSSPPVIQGLNSPDPQVNPDFFDWNLVWVVYCDGASFTGNRESPVNVDGDFIYFRGRRIVDAVFEDLMVRGFDNAERLILTGSSAGSMTALFASDHISRKFAPNIPVRVLSDAGFFVETLSMGGKNVGAMFKQIYDMQNSSSGLNDACIRAYGDNHGWRCFLPETTFRFIKTPSFILNAAYDVWALIYFMGINCKFPSNSYNREKRGIDLLLPYLHSKKKSENKSKLSMDSKRRKVRDISGFEILPFFRPQATDRGSLPIYQPFDQDGYFDPDRNQGIDHVGENPAAVVDTGDNKSPYSPVIGQQLRPEKYDTNSNIPYDHNPRLIPDYVDEQPTGLEPLDAGQQNPQFGGQSNPSMNQYMIPRPISTPLSRNPNEDAGFGGNTEVGNEWLVKNIPETSPPTSSPLYQNQYHIEDLNNEISAQTFGLHSVSITSDNVKQNPRPVGMAVNPFDTLVNVLKNVTKKKADDKKGKPEDMKSLILDQQKHKLGQLLPFQNSKSHLAQGLPSRVPNKPGLRGKPLAFLGQGKKGKPMLPLKDLHKPLNRTSSLNMSIKYHKIVNSTFSHSGKHPVLNKRFNTTVGNKTDGKSQNKRSTNIAKEYISILRSDPPECTDTDMVDVMKYRETMLRATEVIRSSPRSGVFLVSCIDHSLSLFDETWSTIIVNGKTIAQAFGDWYFNRPTNHHDIDCPYPCNPSCP